MPTSHSKQQRRTLLLTGASRGIGHATVKRFSAAGWRVITCSRHAFPENCPWEMGPEDHIQVDLADLDQTQAAIAEIKQRLDTGELNALVNNAAISPKAEGGKEGATPEVEGDGGSPFKTSYYNFSEDFTSNLKNSSALIQVSLACSTHRDGRVLMWLKKHELAVRSAMLEVLADTPEDDVNTIQGKERLQKRLADAINHVLTQEEGFGGVDNVYFKTFLVQ